MFYTELFRRLEMGEQLLHGLSMTPFQRLAWLDGARHFVRALRAAPRTYFEDGKPVRTESPKSSA